MSYDGQHTNGYINDEIIKANEGPYHDEARADKKQYEEQGDSTNLKLFWRKTFAITFLLHILYSNHGTVPTRDQQGHPCLHKHPFAYSLKNVQVFQLLHDL